MFLAADDPRRMSGLIWLDETMSGKPAAHVMIIGVGAYKSPKFKKPLTSTTISARAVADWFIDKAKAGFKNPSAPLGSVALLLSEPETADARDHAIYADGKVPRATFGETYTAVRDWVRRINSNKDNFAFLYVASHGESDLGRTAILLEDYGLDDLNATFGMSEVEQFVGALENAIPIDQLLLFDCCRTPTDMRLPWNERFGSNLISLTRKDDDHGQTRQQCVISATALDKAALGQVGDVTLFADALLQALDGVASDTTLKNWPVRSANLAGKITDLLALHRLPEEDAQIAPGTAKGTFDVSVPGERTNVPVYVFLENPADWPGSVVNVVASSGEKFTIEGVEGKPPFCKITVPMMAEVTAEAKRNGAEIGTASRKAYAPALFLKISKNPADAGIVVGALATKRSMAKAQIDIELESYVQVEAGAVAAIVRCDDPGNNSSLISVPLAGVASQQVRPGEYSITLWTPDGQVHKRDVVVEPNQILKVSFSAPVSPHEWLRTAAISGAIRGRKRVALVIGNSQYENFPTLWNSRGDAEAIASLLSELGFEVIVGIDLAVNATAGKIREFADKIEDAEAALFFFSGHGLQVAGENYLVPVDAGLDAALYPALVSSRELRDRMSGRADISILLLDCYRNPVWTAKLGDMALERGLTSPQRFDQTDNRGGWVVVASNEIAGVASRPPTEHSRFASALLRHVPTPGQSLDDLIRNVMDTMEEIAMREAGHIARQLPSFAVSLHKQFYFIPPAGSSSPYPEVPYPDRSAASDRAGPMAIRTTLVEHLDIGAALDSLSASELAMPGMRLAVSHEDGRLRRIDVEDAIGIRFPPDKSVWRPQFVEVTCGARRELAVIPSIGHRSKDIAGGWLTYLVVDRFSPIQVALTRVIVDDTRWLGLLGFLASRSIDMAEKLLEGGLNDDVLDAIDDKVTNPLAAAAGALVAVAGSRGDVDARWDPWLRNLTDWFPGVPDGSIILARRLLMRARTEQQIAEARRWFFEGFSRGVPVYSLSAEWLARGLESLPGDDDILQQRRRSARRLANQVDSSQVFTVIRIVN